MTDHYVGKHRKPDDEQPKHRPDPLSREWPVGDTDTLRLKIRKYWEWTRPGYPPVFPDDDHHLFTHPGERMHRKRRG